MGGLIIFIRNKFNCLVTRICEEFENGIVLKFSKDLFNVSNDVIFISAYIPPENSPFYNDMAQSGIQCIEKLLNDNLDVFKDSDIVLCGDLNARTGSLCETVNLSNNIPELHEYFDILNDNYDVPRSSCDNKINAFGKELIALCQVYSLIIANGRFGDPRNSGDYTFVGPQGCSVVDYFICSRQFTDSIVGFYIDTKADSDHLPICLDLLLHHESVENFQNNVETGANKRYYYIWKNGNDIAYESFLEDSIINGDFDTLDNNISEINYDVNDIVSDFEELIMQASDPFRKQNVSSVKIANKKWFDMECKAAKVNKITFLKRFRNSRSDYDLQCYLESRKSFKALCRQKRFLFSRKITEELENTSSDSKVFWKTLKRYFTKPKIQTNITHLQWFDHFNQLFNDTDNPGELVFELNEDVNLSDVENTLFNGEITDEEILQAVKDLNPNKSSTGNLVAEHFRIGIHFLLPYIRKLFNRLFQSGEFPESWSKSIIIPLHKKGSIHNPDNYRGIALLDIFSKLYIGILNKRVTFYVNAFDRISEAQAGFRKGYSTIDNAFVLYSLISKQLCMKGKKLYVAFVDFKKAFDSVDRYKLLVSLQNIGLNGHLFSAIASIYKSVKASVRDQGMTTDAFDCPMGVRQGCKLSPILFSIFINELSASINGNGIHGIQLTPDIIEILMLMFADDIALVADTVAGLQNHLNALKKHCLEWKLNVNVEKTKVVIFKNGGCPSKNEKWFYNDKKIETVSSFNYVGVNFTCRLSLFKMAESMAVKAKRVLVYLLQSLQDIQPMSYRTYFKFFDSKISPVLLYGCEIWGLEYIEQIERVHVYACKRFLNAPLKSCNAAIMGDCGRYPMFILAYKRCLKYWIRILAMPDNRYVKKCYEMLKFYDERGYKNWVTRLRLNLFSNGFGYIWVNQRVDDPVRFLDMYVNRLKDQYSQMWRESCSNSSKLILYKQFKPVFEREFYIDVINLKKFRQCFVSFRSSAHKLMIEKGRHLKLSRELRYCIHCDDSIEDEVHFLLYCPLYNDLRSKYIDKRYWEHPSFHNFTSLMSSKCHHTIQNLAMFLYYAMKYRDNFLI